MEQETPVTPLPNCLLLNLSPHLRRIIYAEAGLVVNSRLRSKDNRNDDDRSLLVSFSCALMLTCRLVHAETSLLFYSTNCFVVRYNCIGDLGILKVLRPSLIHALTSLTIQLNVADGHRWQPHHKPANCPTSENELLHENSSFAQCLLSEWETMLHDISFHIKPNTLNFGLICDVADVNTAELVVAPLRQLPPLVACHIRLNPSPSNAPGLQEIARTAVMQVRGGEKFSSYFKYTRLPLELRIRILEYTDLVTPLNDVEWVPGYGCDRGYRLSFKKSACLGASCEPPYDLCHPKAHQLCQLEVCRLEIGNECPHYASGWGWGPENNKYRCWNCSHYACQFRNCWNAKKRRNHQSQFCFCQRHHTAFTSSCQCWQPPGRMFLVSRSFRDDANRVFFGQNHFRMGISGQIPRPLRYPESEFLSDVVPMSALRYIQSLEFRFLTFSDWQFAHQPPTAEDSRPEEHQDWRHTVSQTVNSFDHRLPPLLLHVGTIDLPELESLLTRDDFLTEKSNTAIDLLKTYASTFWPPLLQGSHSRKPQVLLAHLSTESLDAGYFIRPGHPYQEERSPYEPPSFASERDTADLKLERTVTGLDGEELGLDCDGNRWVEGIWIGIQDRRYYLSLPFSKSR